VPRIPILTMDELSREHQYFVQGANGGATSTVTSLHSRVVELEGEVSKLKEQLGRAKGLNDAMWEDVVQKVLNVNEQMNSGMDKELGERSRKRSRIVT
jgi:pre-rRNA-processing protein IPI3